MIQPPKLSLFDRGMRKYLSQQERERFYKEAIGREESLKLFLLMLFYSGARISEVLNLEKGQIDKDENLVIFECLKKRKKGIYRTVPLPEKFVKSIIKYGVSNNGERLWSISRSTASRRISKVMNTANISGIQACAKGLRHSFAVLAVQRNVPLTLIKKWMGHASISTTEIYLSVTGEVERKFSNRMWE